MRTKFKNLNILFCIIFSMLMLFNNKAYAILNLELTKGIDSAIPIAIVPFAGDGSTDSNNISKIIATDLHNSGRFNVLPSQNIKQFPHSPREINADYWQQQKLDYIVVGSIQSLGGSQYRVQFNLESLFKNKSTESGENKQQSSATLASGQFTVSDTQLRLAAHKISDIIYEKLLGIKGVFSTKIAYVVVKNQGAANAQYHLEVADMDGYNPQAILSSRDPIMSPSWSPDGKSIAYVSFEVRKASVYVSDIASGNRKLVTQYPAINGAPAWSSDSKKLAVVLSKDGAPNIYLIELATGGLTKLTNDYAIDTEPRFSPDGRSIIYTSSQGGSPQIYKMDLATKQTSRLSFSGSYNASASFTPDGKSIVMLHKEDGFYHIAVQDLQSGNLFVLPGNYDQQSPNLAPNGQMVIYEIGRNSRGVLGMMSIDGKVKIQLPTGDGDVREPTWGPFR